MTGYFMGLRSRQPGEPFQKLVHVHYAHLVNWTLTLGLS
jgi:hypothetical protein